MHSRIPGLARALFAGALLGLAAQAQAVTEIQWWHSMTGANNDRVNALAKRFNDSQKDYKVTAVYKGQYDESMTAAIAAFRAGNAPAILQVFEVGTATMMSAKGAIKPVYQVMADAGEKFDPKSYVPAVAGYYTNPKGQMLSFPFNSSTTVFYYNKDAFEKAGLDPNQPPATWQAVAAAAAKIKASGVLPCSYTTGWQSWVQLESFSAWHNVPFLSKDNGFSGADAKLVFNGPVQTRHIENLQDWIKKGYFVYGGRKNEPEAKFFSGELLPMVRPMASGSFAMAATVIAGTPLAMKPMPGPEPSEKSIEFATIACCSRASPPNPIDSTSSPYFAQMPFSVPISIGAKANVVEEALPTRM